MKRWLAISWILLLAGIVMVMSTAPRAQVKWELFMANGSGTVITPATFTQTDSSSSLTGGSSTINWNGASVGVTNPKVVVLFWSAQTTVINGATIGGVTATCPAGASESSIISGINICYATGVTGPTVNISVTASGNMTIPLAVLGTVNTSTTTPGSTNSGANAGSCSQSLSLTVPTNGVGVWWGVSGITSNTGSWSIITTDVALNSSSTNDGVEGHYTTSGTSNPTFTGGSACSQAHAVGATWGP